MIKLLVNTPNGAQELIEVGEGGGYFDASLVLWDERMDGPLPAITLGGMVRTGNALAFDTARMDTSDAVISTAAMRDKINALEASMTPRRIREATLGTDAGWLAALDAQIAALRAQLTAAP